VQITVAVELALVVAVVAVVAPLQTIVSNTIRNPMLVVVQ
jgi:hypothetical protein